MVKIVASCAIGVAAVLLAYWARVVYSGPVIAGAAGLVAYQEMQGASAVNDIYNDCVLHRNPDASVWEQGVPCTARALYWLFKSGAAAGSGYAIMDSIRSGMGNAIVESIRSGMGNAKKQDGSRKRGIVGGRPSNQAAISS